MFLLLHRPDGSPFRRPMFLRGRARPALIATSHGRPLLYGSSTASSPPRIRKPNAPLPFIGAADRTSFYQLKTMLQRVVARGTARSMANLWPFVAGKTGTTEDAVDGWFIGFTNDVTVAVWVGYDNGDRKRRSLGTRASGAGVALPIFEPHLARLFGRRALRLVPGITVPRNGL